MSCSERPNHSIGAQSAGLGGDAGLIFLSTRTLLKSRPGTSGVKRLPGSPCWRKWIIEWVTRYVRMETTGFRRIPSSGNGDSALGTGRAAPAGGAPCGDSLLKSTVWGGACSQP